MYAFIGLIIISHMQAFVFSNLQYVCFYYNHVIGTDLEEVRLCGLAHAWGAICTLGLYFFTPHATTCLLFLLLVTTVYSDLFSSSFFLSFYIYYYLLRPVLLRSSLAPRHVLFLAPRLPGVFPGPYEPVP